MNNLAPIIVAVFIRDPRTGKYLFGKRKGTGHGGGLWALAGGHVEKTDTSLEKAANRESVEETNLTLGKIKIIYQKYYHYEDKGGMLVVFLHGEREELPDKFLNNEPINKEPHKCERWEWFDLEKDPSDPCMEPLETLMPLLKEIIKGDKQ